MGASALSQSVPSSVILNEGFESSSITSFQSRYYGSVLGSQFSLDPLTVGGGQRSLRHRLTAGMTAGQIQYATQHFGDANAQPVLANGRGQHFYDIYVQYRVYYSPGFDFRTLPKQLIIGTEDDRRHDNVCCNPWVSHYMTIFPPHSSRSLVAEANNKQGEGSQWFGFYQNRSGYSASNPMVVQSGRWYTVEVRRRLNDIGSDNGIFQMWVDGVLLSEATNVRYRVGWNGTVGANPLHGTNFAMISDYIIGGSTAEQSIYYDDIIISTERIGSGPRPPAPPSNLRFIS